LNQAESLLDEEYYRQRNAVAAEGSRAKAAFNEFALGAGAGIGTRAQEELARTNAYRSAISDIRAAELEARNQIALEKARLKAEYQAALSEAASAGEYERLTALIENARSLAAQERELEQQTYNRSLTAAETLAAYGNFSGYLALGYTPEQVEHMRSVWAAANPELAGATATTAGKAAGTPYLDVAGTQPPLYSNEGLTTEQIKYIQEQLGVTPDGVWGPESSRAAGGLSPSQVWDNLKNIKNIKNYESTTSYLTSQGVSGALIAGLLTEKEWRRKKLSGSASWAVQYPSYESYLDDYVEYCLNPEPPESPE
jgi:murein L,D-transpeptidase YcbB/YkuD